MHYAYYLQPWMQHSATALAEPRPVHNQHRMKDAPVCPPPSLRSSVLLMATVKDFGRCDGRD